jgi:PAS domain S-box-containing protein
VAICVGAVGTDVCAASAPPVVQVGSELEFPPYAFVDEHGRPAGFSVDLIHAVTNAMGISIQISTGPWDAVWTGLVEGRLDVLPIVAKLPERVALVDFSLPHTETYDAFFVRKGSTPPQTINDARGKEIVVMRSDAAHHALVERHFDGRLILADSIPQGLALLASGKHDAFLGSKLIGTLAIKQTGIKGLTVGPPIPDYKRVFSFGVKKGATALVEQLNQGLLIVKTNGEYDRIYAKWLSAEDPWRQWEKYFWPAVLIVSMAGLIAGIWMITLHRLVGKRTRELAESNARLRGSSDALRQAGAYTRSLIEASLDPLVTIGADGKITDVNAATETVTGYARTDLIGTDFSEYFTEPEQARAGYEQVFREGFVRDYALDIRHRDGHVTPVLYHAALYRDASGKVSGAFAAARDITERKRTEEVLRESEAKLEEAQRLTHVGYWDRDLDTNLITWSAETYRIFGVFREEQLLTFDRVRELIHSEDLAMVRETVAAALRGGPRYDAEFRVVRPNGDVRIIHSQADVTWDESGRPRRMFGTVQDITERKRVEERLVVQFTVTQILAESGTVEEATPKILRSLGETLRWDVGALWRVDRAAGVLRCVQVWHKRSVEVPAFESACRETTFVPGIGLPGRVWFQREPVYIPDVTRDANFPRAPIAGRELLHAGFGFPILLGREVLGVIEFFSREIRQPDQDLHEMMASIGSQIGQFIERKRAEGALLTAQAELTHVTRVATLGELAASIAHETSQPLAAIVNNANACVRWLAANNIEEARQCAVLIRADSHRAGEIIQRIRSFAKKAPPQKDWIDINHTVREAIALARSEVQRRGISLNIEVADALESVVFADRVQLQQVILNLIMNAVEAMSESTEGPRQLLIGTGSDTSGAIVVSVRDTGPGLSCDNPDRLFTPFYTTKPQGLGMGLPICRSIVEAHGGRLWATANEDRGATFQFTLPTGGERIAPVE